MDISRLLKSLNAQHVRYVVIGGMALPAHGYFRFTGDIDIFIEPTQQNAERTLAARTARVARMLSLMMASLSCWKKNGAARLGIWIQAQKEMKLGR